MGSVGWGSCEKGGLRESYSGLLAMTRLPCVVLGGGLEGGGCLVQMVLAAQLSSCWWDAPQRWDGDHSPGDGCFSPEMGVTAPRWLSQP